jgi:hypothetical protein
LVHVLSMHMSPPPQTTPHPPQLFGSLLVSMQPLGQQVSPVGQAGPPLHMVGIVQTLMTQVSPAGQTTPHPPQFFGSVAVLVHIASQQTSPVAQTPHVGGWQMPPAQLSPVGQAFPHLPQLFGSVSMSVQPVWQHCSTPVQTGPPLHDIGGVHTPPTHVSPVAQTSPHPLQFFGSVLVSVHPLGQHCSTPVQTGPPLQVAAALQTAPTHVSPGAQAMPHPPQLSGSVSMSVHPLAQHCSAPRHGGWPLHVVPGMQLLSEHWLPGGQTSPHPPQLFGSVVVSVHPSAQHCSMPSHGGRPLQETLLVQTPPEHVAPGGQTSPHPPQLSGSLSTSVHPLAQHCKTPWQGIPPSQPVGGVHSPATQEKPPGQGSPHPPQLFGSVSMLVQPVSQHWSRPTQIGPPLQDWGGVQLPLTQVKLCGHSKPHMLQLFGSVLRSVQPVAQQLWSPLHVPSGPHPIISMLHVPPMHTVTPPGTAPQMLPQPPQFWMSLSVSVQPVGQHESPGLQGGPPVHPSSSQEPCSHVSFDGQTVVQLPQWPPELSMSTQTSLQQASPPGHPVVLHPFGDWQMPPMQIPVGHETPHPPQLFGSVPSSMQPPPQQERSLVQAAPPAHDGTHSMSSQMSPAGHWLDMRQPTHCPVPTSHTGLVAGHWLFIVQPGMG